MIKEINNFLTQDELKLAQEYWKIREPSLKPCAQSKKSVAIYSDFLSETLVSYKKSIVEKAIGEQLTPTYTYSRMYHKGGELVAHNDRPSCEVSITLNIFADKDWSIWFHKLKEGTKEVDPNVKPSSYLTKPGDAVVYEGCNYSHWREPYDGEKCMQVFLHYIRTNGQYKSFALDGRKYLGQDKDEAMRGVWQ
tara:strand:- start:709 stop:1287 length:579 start_codon:yes stop_codon:yes gene_type:complete